MPLSPKDAYQFCPRCGKMFADRDHVVSTCKECGLRLYHSPKPCVGIILVEQESNHILLVRRGIEPHKGTWDVPGGFCEAEETMIGAAIREAREELHVEIEVDAILDSLPETYLFDTIQYPLLATFVVAHIVSGHPTPDDDIDDMKYFSIDEALSLPFGFPSLKKGIELYVQERKRRV